MSLLQTWTLQRDPFLRDVSRRKVHNVRKYSTNVEMIELRYYIWNHRVKYMRMSTNMPGIGSVIRELTFKFVINLRKQKRFSMMIENCCFVVQCFLP